MSVSLEFFRQSLLKPYLTLIWVGFLGVRFVVVVVIGGVAG